MMAVWAGFKGWRWFQLKFGTTWGSYDWYEWDENIISITRTPGGWVAGAPLTLTEVEDKLYCKRCWKHYGWYIKNGPPYTLSLHLDRLARKHGVRIVEVNVGKGKAKGKGLQPFECCNQRFNHKRLASHLQSHEAAESKTEMDTQTDLIWVEDNFQPDVCWEFEVKDGTWQAFLQEVQDELEGHYALLHPLLDLGGPNQVTITTNGFTYEINFKDMTQKKREDKPRALDPPGPTAKPEDSADVGRKRCSGERAP